MPGRVFSRTPALIGVLALTGLVAACAGPSARSKIRATLARGTPVTESGPPRGNWQPVETPKGNGWIFNRYLAPSS